MRQHYQLSPIASVDGARQFLVDFAEGFPARDAAPVSPEWPTSARALIVACPLAHNRDTCVCNNGPYRCAACRGSAGCGCPVEVEVEFARLIDGGFRVVRMPDGCPLSGGRYTKAERAELMTRIAAAFECLEFDGHPFIGDDEDRAHTAQWHRHLASPDDN